MSVYFEDERLTLLLGDAYEQLKNLDDGSVQSVVTSPPYFGLRDYGEEGQYGSEESVDQYVNRLSLLFRGLRRVLADDGTAWLNLGDSYSGSGGNGSINPRLKGRAPENIRNRPNATQNAGLPPRNLMGIPWRVALALQADGWWLRQEIIWRKPNGMPVNAADRFESRHEHIFLLSKSSHYYFAQDARELGHSDVWDAATASLSGAHVAVMPSAVAARCVLAGSRVGDVVLDPFSGSGTTGMVALEHGRRYVGIDINSDYLDLSLRERFNLRPLDIYGGAA